MRVEVLQHIVNGNALNTVNINRIYISLLHKVKNFGYFVIFFQRKAKALIHQVAVADENANNYAQRYQ